MTDQTPEQTNHGWIRLVFGCLGFGVLMAARGEFDLIWMRSAVAGCAFVVLGFSMRSFRKAKT